MFTNIFIISNKLIYKFNIKITFTFKNYKSLFKLKLTEHKINYFKE